MRFLVDAQLPPALARWLGALTVALLAGAERLDWSRLWTFTNYSGEVGGNVFPQSDNMGYLFLLCLLLLKAFVILCRW